MDNFFTLSELTEFTKNEKQLLQDLGLEPIQKEKVDDTIVNSLLNYSLSLSVRKSKLLKEDYFINLN